jgi:hypothetical protein
MKIPEKIMSVGFVSGVRLCHKLKMGATRNNFSSLREKNGPRKVEIFCITFGGYRLKQTQVQAQAQSRRRAQH